MNLKTVLTITWVCILSLLFPVFSTIAEELESTNFKLIGVTTQGGGITESDNYRSLLTTGNLAADPTLYSETYKMYADPAMAFRPAVPTVSCFETTTDGYSNCLTGPEGLRTDGMVSLCGGDGCYDKARFEIGTNPYMYSTEMENIIGYWTFDEESGSGAFLKDRSGNENHATPSGTSYTEGRANGARSFNGSTDHISMGKSTNILGSNPNNVTISFFAKLEHQGSFQRFVTLYDSGTTSGFGIRTDNNNRLVVFSSGTPTSTTIYLDANEYQNTNLSLNNWYHITVVWENASLSLGNGDALVGVHSNMTQWFKGTIDEVLIFDEALTQQQINQLFLSSRENKNPEDTLYAVEISTDNFSSDIRYIDGSTNEPKSLLTLNDFRTKGQWEQDTFNILGLNEGTEYQIRIAALHGDFTQTEKGPSSTATTAGTSSYFDIDIADETGIETESSPPYNIFFTSPNSLLAGAGPATAEDLIWFDAETNASGGFAIIQRGLNGGLLSNTHSVQIDSVTGDLNSLSEGFGLQNFYIDFDNPPEMGEIISMPNYSNSNNSVGIVDTDWNKIYDANGPIVAGRLGLYVKARAAADKLGATDYNETITFVFVPRY